MEETPGSTPLVADDAMSTVVAEAERVAPRRPFDRCRGASDRLIRALIRKGIDARMIGGRGHLVDRPSADRRWLALHRRSWTHYAVHVPSLDVVVDPTWRQFDVEGDRVRILDARTFNAEWSEAVDA